MTKITFLWAACLLMVLWGCEPKHSAEESNPAKPLNTYFRAFNEHNIEEMLATTTPDVRVMSVWPDTMTVDITGRAALRSWLEGYFARFPDVQSKYGTPVYRQPFFSFEETASWGPEGTRKSQSSMATYQISEGKIHRVWYYFTED